MEFSDRIVFRDLVGSHAVAGSINPNGKELVVRISESPEVFAKKVKNPEQFPVIEIDKIDKLVNFRDKLTAVIDKFAEATGTKFK